MKTRRLHLRQWLEKDYQPFAQLNADPEVMAFLPTVLSQNESDRTAEAFRAEIAEQGWGLWAIELLSEETFIGFCGLHRPTVDLPFGPCVEIGWRLAKSAWGQGYATEAGARALEFAFVNLKLHEIVSFTALINKKSQAVMRKLGLTNTHQNFFHPSLSTDSPLREHVLYRINHFQWQKNHFLSQG